MTSKKKQGPPLRRNLTTTQMRANEQVGENRNAEDAYTHGSPREWSTEQVIDSVRRAGYQTAQAQGRGAEANVARGRATELICETILGICSAELGDEWMHNTEGNPFTPAEARLAFANHVYSEGFLASTDSAGARWDKGDRTASTRDKQISGAAALWSGKRPQWANALVVYQQSPSVIQAILDPNRRKERKDGTLGDTMSWDARAKEMQSKVDDMCKKEEGTKWTDCTLALTQAQVNLNTHTATRNAMRKKNTSAFELDVVVRNKGRVEEWNSHLQSIIDGDSNL